MIGTGYVGLVTATCFAESGNHVVGIDSNAEKIAMLQQDQLPIYEPGLLDLLKRNRKSGRLRFSTDYADGIPQAEVIFLAVGTPQNEAGEAELGYLWSAADSISDHLDGAKIVATKSTVPVGTNRLLAQYFAGKTSHPVDVVSNPEFLKEGHRLG